MTRCLEMEPVPNMEAGSVVMRVNRNHPGRWGDDDAPGQWLNHGAVQRGIAAVVPSVVGAVAVFDGPSVAMLVAPVVGLLFFVFAGVVVMVVMSAMGFRGRTQTDTSDDHHERSDAKTLNKRHRASMN